MAFVTAHFIGDEHTKVKVTHTTGEEPFARVEVYDEEDGGGKHHYLSVPWPVALALVDQVLEEAPEGAFLDYYTTADEDDEDKPTVDLQVVTFDDVEDELTEDTDDVEDEDGSHRPRIPVARVQAGGKVA